MSLCPSAGRPASQFDLELLDFPPLKEEESFFSPGDSAAAGEGWGLRGQTWKPKGLGSEAPS